MSAPLGNKNAKGHHKTYNEIHRKHGGRSTHAQTKAKEELKDPKYEARLKSKRRVEQ
jgi:hypothetical protein